MMASISRDCVRYSDSQPESYIYSSSDSDSEANTSPDQKKQKLRHERKLKGAAVYSTSYSANETVWKKTFDCVSKSSVSDEHVFCNVCKKDLSVAHQGIADIRRHTEGKRHRRMVQGLKNQPRVGSFFNSLHDKVRPLNLIHKTYTASVINCLLQHYCSMIL